MSSNCYQCGGDPDDRNELKKLRAQLDGAMATLKKVLHACNVPASYSQEHVRSEIVGIISAHLSANPVNAEDTI